MPNRPDTLEVLRALRVRLQQTLTRLTAAQAAAQAGAVHAEAKQEHAKDMRSTEAGYLSRGLAERVETMAESVRILAAFAPRARRADAPIELGNLIGLVDEDGTESLYFLAPVGGGEKLAVGTATVMVLTAGAPLGAALLGRHDGDEIDLALPGTTRTLAVAWVS